LELSYTAAPHEFAPGFGAISPRRVRVIALRYRLQLITFDIGFRYRLPMWRGRPDSYACRIRVETSLDPAGAGRQWTDQLLAAVIWQSLGHLPKDPGFKSCPELTLAIDDAWKPTPDVCGIPGPEADLNLKRCHEFAAFVDQTKVNAFFPFLVRTHVRAFALQGSRLAQSVFPKEIANRQFRGESHAGQEMLWVTISHPDSADVVLLKLERLV
jgi:hypothetical protein